MDDYLTMIKNPKRKPSTSPAPGPSNPPRSSYPFPNPTSAPSTNPTYINNLDRIKSIDVQSWGNKDPQDTPSSRAIKSPYESPYDSIRQETPSRQNRFSAPIASIGEKSSIPNQSLFGDVPQKPQNILDTYKSPYVAQGPVIRDRSPGGGLFGPNQDVSPRSSFFGSNVAAPGQIRRPLEVATASALPNNNDLFGNTSFKGSSTQDSLTHRRSLNSQQSATMKLSDGRRLSQDVSPKFGNKDKPKKSKKRKLEIPIIILGVLLVVLVAVAIKLVFMTEHVVFCDSGSDKHPIPGCKPCPDHGTCKGGILIKCDDKYKKYKNECVLDYEIIAKYAQYRNYINDRLAYLKGEKLCNATIVDFFTLPQIRSELQARYPKDSELHPTNYEFESRWDDHFETEEGLIKEPRYGGSIYFTSDEGSPSLSCKFKLLWREGKLAGIWFSLFVGTIVLAVKLIRLHLVYSKLGKEMYEDVREYLTHFKNVSVKTLKKEFEHKYPGKKFEKIWSYVESYRKQDAKIYQYFDTYQGLNQEFWLRVR